MAKSLGNVMSDVKNGMKEYFSRIRSRLDELNESTNMRYEDKVKDIMGPDTDAKKYSSFKQVAFDAPDKLKADRMYDAIAKHVNKNPTASSEEKTSVVKAAMRDTNKTINKMNGAYLAKCSEKVINATQSALETSFKVFKEKCQELGKAIHEKLDEAKYNKMETKYNKLGAELAGSGYHLQREDVTGDKSAVAEIVKDKPAQTKVDPQFTF